MNETQTFGSFFRFYFESIGQNARLKRYYAADVRLVSLGSWPESYVKKKKATALQNWRKYSSCSVKIWNFLTERYLQYWKGCDILFLSKKSVN